MNGKSATNMFSELENTYIKIIAMLLVTLFISKQVINSSLGESASVMGWVWFGIWTNLDKPLFHVVQVALALFSVAVNFLC